ncbi:MAG: hypothetical protein HYY36_06275 [Gammaproteobacteria bacterium]|nr:hypothetical protein [Gammaproteobacteria bacterium]
MDAPRLSWRSPESRPVLRPFARLISVYLHTRREVEAIALAEKLLALNPGDNHGFRGIVMNEYLRTGRDAEALELSARYPDDAQPEIPYGRVLAFYRQGRLDEAQEALHKAVDVLPKVVRYLTSSNVRKPKFRPEGITFGGDDQAWMYREEMREVWLQIPGALDWLKKAAKT